jgi:hypothetical protein
MIAQIDCIFKDIKIMDGFLLPIVTKPDNSEHVVQRSKAVSGAGAPDEIRTLISKSP